MWDVQPQELKKRNVGVCDRPQKEKQKKNRKKKAVFLAPIIVIK